MFLKGISHPVCFKAPLFSAKGLFFCIIFLPALYSTPVQKRTCTDVQKRTCTDVQLYKSTCLHLHMFSDVHLKIHFCN